MRAHAQTIHNIRSEGACLTAARCATLYYIAPVALEPAKCLVFGIICAAQTQLFSDFFQAKHFVLTALLVLL